jgi:hypothetical protein
MTGSSQSAVVLIAFAVASCELGCARESWYPPLDFVGADHDDGCDDLILDPMAASPEVRVEPGRFEFGQSPEYYAEYWQAPPDERVEVTIELSYAFYVDSVETTHGYWTSLMGFSSFLGPDSCVACAESGVHFFDALLYANRRSEAAGLEPCYNLSSCNFDAEGRPLTCDLADLDHPVDCSGYRIPTRPEWVRAARADTTTDFLCEGEEDPTDSLTGCMADYSYAKTFAVIDDFGDFTFGRPVGKRCPNAFGVYDVYGNVAEWVFEGITLPEWWPVEGASDPIGPSPAVLPDNQNIGQMGGGLWEWGGRLAATFLDAAYLEREAFDALYSTSSGVRLVRTAFD